VLNGMAAADGGLERARLGILPLGTINVFAKDLGLPSDPDRAWGVIRAGRDTTVDLPWVEFQTEGRSLRRCFAQLAGAGLDSRAISFVDWTWKTKVGPLAYAAAAFKAIRGRQPLVTVELPDGRRASGELVLVGNGTLYGGWVTMFPGASRRDGQLNIRVLPRVGTVTLLKFGLAWLFRSGFTVPGETRFSAERFVVTSEPIIPLEVDGDNAGSLPAAFSVQREAFRVVV
jgi:diacylglycerol kinase (ATP)